MRSPDELKRVAIVGGGLAGLSAAAALAEYGAGLHIEIFESRRTLGGRAGSFVDPGAGQQLDHCQHVGMGCCTNLVDFCRRTGIESLFTKHRVLHFFGPDGRRYDLSAARWLPAPMHLAPSLMRLAYLSLAERWSVARTMMRLARWRPDGNRASATFGQWLVEQRQSRQAIDRFWSIVIVSALSEDIDSVSIPVARKVFLDGFLAHRRAYEIALPTRPLGELYGERVARWLRERGVALHLGRAIAMLSHAGDRDAGDRITGAIDAHGVVSPFDAVVVACPWRHVANLIPPQLRAALPELDGVERLTPAPITAFHLWFDRPLTELPHAVLIDRLSQWVFAHGERLRPHDVPRDEPTDNRSAHYYQVVISASRPLADRPRSEVLAELQGDLAAVFPAAESARLLHWRMVTQHEAVFSPRPETELLRPGQQSSIDNLYWAGDWTATGWPATMESAVRSGYLAAESLLAKIGKRPRILAPDLPRNLLVRRLCGTRRSETRIRRSDHRA